jgi:hypothetical protein
LGTISAAARQDLRLISTRRAVHYFDGGTARRLAMQQIASPWRKFSLRLTVLIIVAVVGGWAMSAVFASKPSPTVGAAVDAPAPAEAAIISPMELMIGRGRHLPIGDYVEPF